MPPGTFQAYGGVFTNSLRRFRFRRGKLREHGPDQLAQKVRVLDPVDKEHLLRPLVGELPERVGHALDRGLHGLDQKAVVVDPADHPALTVQDVFAHHGAEGDPVQPGQLLQHKIQIFL